MPPIAVRTKSDAPFARRPVFEELESRLLMSADLNLLTNEALLATPALQGAEFRALSDDGSAVTRTVVTAVQRRNEIVFVDPRVPDRERLLAGLTAQSDRRSFEVIELDPRREGVTQITEALRGRMQVDAVHFITHGVDGAVQLGGTWLDAKTLAANADAVAKWGDSLKQDADLLFYGCDLASSASGRALMGWIAELTRGDVAASDDPTGAAGQGGDWELEARVGSIETAVAVTANARAGWSHVLSGVPVGIESPANITPNSNLQEAPAVATAPDGRFVVAWTSNSQDGNGLGVYARLYDAAGTPQSGEILVNQTTLGDQSRATVAIDAAGNFVVAWSGNGTGGDGADVFFRRFTATGADPGAGVLGEVRVNVAIPGNQSRPAIAMETNGDFAIVWQSDETGDIEIWMRRFFADGTSAGGNILVSTSGGDDDVDPSIAMDDDGDFVVAWESEDANNSGVFAQRYSNAGIAQGGIISVNSTTQGEQQRPDVAMDAVGNFVIVWDGEGATDDKGIYGRRYTAAGTAQGAEFRVSTLTGPDQTAASVSMSGGGRFVVAWESDDQDTNNLGVYAKEFAPSGVPESGEFRVNTTVAGDQGLPAVAMDDAGGYVAAWSGQGVGDGNGVFWLRYAPAATGTISGTIFHDVDGDADITESGTLLFAGATVRLFREAGVGGMDAGDIFVASTLTDAAGAYSFTGLSDGTYYVVVDSRLLTAATNVWAEQTYGVAGSALGAGFTIVDGAVFGGRNPNSSDNSTDLPTSLVTSEHAAMATLSGTGTGGVDFGFSFNAITTNRDGDDDTVSGDRSIQGSLRQFIQNANAISNSAFGGGVEVRTSNFSIGSGPRTIVLASALPAITDAVVLDAGTQEGFGGTPLIEVNGAGMSGGITLQSGSSGSVVRGLVINRFSGSGLFVAGGSNGNTISGNWIGTDAAGTGDLGNNGDGILIDGDDNTVTGNVISGNQSDGIQINGGAAGNRVLGNLIGTDRSGDLALANSGTGINIIGGGNTVGGAMSGDRNVISGNFQGISISTAQAVGNVIQGNHIGTDITGTKDLGNASDGIRIFDGARGTVIGAGNLISGNNGDGVEISGPNTTGNLVQGNLIGTVAGGSGALPNSGSGVRISAGATSNTIGGMAGAERNVISGNAVNGVELEGAGTTGNLVAGNTIGLNAAGTTAVANGLSGVMLIDASGNTIGVAGAGNVLSGNVQDGITGFRSNANLIEGNYIGTDATGSLGRGNVEDGIYFEDSSNNTIGGITAAARNVISANGWSGITLWGAGSGNVVQGNYIGTDATGGAPLGNGEQGALIVTSGPDTIGGTASGAGNLIAYNGSSGAGWDGVAIMAGAGHRVTGNTIHSNSGDGLHVEASGTIIAGNYIGTDASGTAGLGNAAWGVHLASDFNRVGGAAAGEGNVIADSGIDGIFVDASNGNVIQGNYIGTNSAGAAGLGNAEDGIWLNDASNTLIGGTTAAARNVISGNLWSGVAFLGGGSNNVVQGNLIGVDATGTGPLGNLRHGVDIGGSVDTTVEANVIANNGWDGASNDWDGVSITSGTGHTISDNAIYANAGLGIDIGNDGVTPNDTPDTDGAQNFPVLTAAVTTGAQVTISGTLNSTPGATFRLEFFASPAPGDASGYGEGEHLLGAVQAIDGGASDLDGTVNGAVTFSATLTPVGSVAVNERISATATDLGTGDTSEFSAHIAATLPNTAPVANNVSVPGNEDDPSIAITLTGTDAEGPIASFRIVGLLPTNGLLYTDSGLTTLAAAGTDYPASGGTLTLYFVPAANSSGSTGFQFTATDAGGLTSAALGNATINVAAVNDAPVALGESYSVTEDWALSVPAGAGVLVNDSDIDGPALTAVLDAGPANGSVTLSPNGSFTYIPNAHFNGVDTFSYHAFDGSLSSATTTVTITVTPVSDAPEGTDGTIVLSEDGFHVFTATDFGFSDPNDAPSNGFAAVQLASLPTAGALTLSGGPLIVGDFIGVADIAAGNLRFTPAPDASGNPYASFSFRVQDSGSTANGGEVLDQTPNTITIVVIAANDAPIVNGDTATVVEDSGANTIDVLANDSTLPDAGETLTITGVTQGASGTVAIVGGTSVTYTSNADFFGADSFTYTVSDGNGGIATATVNVTVTNVNDPPVANDDTPTVAEDSGANTIDVLANDSILPDAGETLSITAVTQGANGSVAIVGGATVTYTPNAEFVGTDTFSYTIDDNNGGTATATVNVTVTSVNDLPVANDDVAAVNEDSGANTIDVLANDSILPDVGETLTITGVTQGANGSVAIVGGTTVTYTPNANFFGADSFTYTIADGNGGAATATVNVTVTPVNDTPDARDDTYSAGEDTPLVFGAPGVLANDVDVGDGPLTLSVTGVPIGGTVVLNNNGSFTFTPTLDFTGTASFTYLVQDVDGESDTAKVDIAVGGVNDVPVLDLDADDSSGVLGSDYGRTFTEDLGSVRVVDTDAVLTDVDSPTLTSVTITITNLLDGAAEVLSATVGATGILANYSGGVLTLTGGTSVADYEQVLRTVRYDNTLDAPNATQRLITFVANDGMGLSNVATARVTIAPVNDAPTADIAAPSYAAIENGTPLQLHATGMSVADIDALPTSVITVYLDAISGLLSATAGSTGVVVAGSGSPTLTFTGTFAQINSLLAGGGGATISYVVGSDSPAPTDMLSLAINDNGATGSGGAQWGWDGVDVDLTAVNDAPLITLPGLASTPEDTPLVFSSGGGNQISITDVDAAGAPVEVALNVTNGLITLAGTSGLTFVSGANGTTAMTFSGPVANVNAALDGLVFAPTANYIGLAFLSVSVNDQGASGLGGPLTDADVATITVNSVNDLPSGANNTVSIPQDGARIFGAADFGFSDGDAGDSMSGVRIDMLSIPPGATLQLSGIDVIAGQVVAAANLGNLVFNPAPGDSGAAYASFTFSVQDTNGPAFAVSPNTMTVNVTPAGTPGISVTPTAGLVTTEAGGTATFSVVLDTQPVADVVITLASSNVAEGTVAPASLTFTSANWNVAQVVTVTGVSDAVSDGSVLYAIVLDPAMSADPGYNGLDPVDVSVTNVEANAAPTVTIAQPSYLATEGSFLDLAGTGLAVADADSGASSVTVTLAVTAGLLQASGLPTVAVSGSGTPVVTLTGPLADISALLAGGGMVNYFVVSDSPPPNDTLTLSINDNHPTDPRTASATVAINIAAVNDAPVNTLPGGATTLEDTPLVYSAAGGNQISITDVDAGSVAVRVSLAGSNGVVTLGSAAGVAFTAGDGTADANMTFTGSVAAINAALDGLVFTPNLNYNGLAFITMTTSDLGASGTGGALSDTDLATIDVLPVNDAPDGTDTTVIVNEDSTYTFSAGNLGFNDVDFGDAMTEVRIDSISLPAGATLMLGATPVAAGNVIPVASIGNLVFAPVANANGAGYASFTFSVKDAGVPPGPLFDPVPNTMTINVAPVNDLPVITSDGGLATAALTVVENTTGVTTVTATDIDLQPLTFSIAGGLDAARFSINATTGVLTFNPAPNFEVPGDSGANNVYDLIVRVDDGAGGSDTQALSITVTDTNDAPFVTGDAYTTVEDTPLSVAAPGALANDGDEDLNPVTATLVSGPANGSVAFNADGSFVYTPNANFAGIDSFTYHVSDGALVSADATITIAVSPVNDAPTAANGNVLSTPAVAYTFTLADFNYTDVDGDPLDHVQITALPTVGSLTLGGVTVTLNQVVDAADIAAGNLQYVAPTGTVAADSFGFRVHDGTLYGAAGQTMTIGFIVPAPPPAPPEPPPTITPLATPPALPAPLAPTTASNAEPSAAGESQATGGAHGGGGGGAAGTAPMPTFAENAPAATESVAAPAAAAVTAAPIAALAGPSGGVSASSGGLQTDPRSPGSVEALQSRGELPEAEVKAAMQEIAVMRDQEFRQELNKLREEVQQEAVVETRVAASVFAVSTGLSVGYVLWLLRGGVLLASLLSSIPAWRLLDPLPVLGRVGGQSDEDDESLEDMVDNQPDRDEAGTHDGAPAPRGAMRVLQAFRRSTR